MRNLIEIVASMLCLLSFSACQKEDSLNLSIEEACVEYDIPFITLNTSGFRLCEVIYKNQEGKTEIGRIEFTTGTDSYEGEWFEVFASDRGKFVLIKFDTNNSSNDRSMILSFDDGDVFNRCSIIQKRNP